MTERDKARRKTPSAPVVADRLHSAAIHLLRSLRRTDEATGLSAARLSALSVLVFGGPMTLGDLAAAEQVRPPTMSNIVSGLVEEGLVRRTAHPDDGRAVRISATAKGIRVLERGRRLRVASLAKRLAALEPREVATLDGAARIIECVAAGRSVKANS